MRTLTLLLFLGITWLAAASPGFAEPITVDSGWINFQWDGGPHTFSVQGPYTFSSSVPTTLTITDVFLVGDRFAAYDQNALLGLTSVPNSNSLSDTSFPDAALADPSYSHGVFSLSAGSHSLTFEAIQVTQGTTGGGAYFRVDSGVTTQTPSRRCCCWPAWPRRRPCGVGRVAAAGKRSATPQ